MIPSTCHIPAAPCNHQYEDVGEAGNTVGGLYACRLCGADARDEDRAPPPPPPAQSSSSPIDFLGEWDSAVVEHKQITYLPNGYRVYLTEAQIDRLIDSRQRMRDAGQSERRDVPYFFIRPDTVHGGSDLVRRLNGVEEIGYVGSDGVFRVGSK